MNWRQEVAAATTAIPGVSDNPATLVLRLADPGGFYSPASASAPEVRRKLVTRFPSPVREKFIDGRNYIAGDREVVIDYPQMSAAMVPQDDDPAEFALERHFTAAGNWGIVPGRDRFTIGGMTWVIVKLEAYGMLQGEPAKFRLTLRK